MTMTPMPQDEPLYAAVSGTAPQTIAGVLAIMQQIDAVLPDDDGLKWFNRLYLMVTQEVDFHPPVGGWKDQVWLLALDVIFAGLYFQAIKDFLRGEASVALAWKALLQARARPDVDRIQFAVAGMNAHIDHDLPLALLETEAQTGVVADWAGPQHADFQAVNNLLNAVLPTTLSMLAVDPLGDLAQATGRPGRLLGMWNVVAARDLAWTFASACVDWTLWPGSWRLTRRMSVPEG